MRLSKLPSVVAVAVIASCGGSDATTPAKVVSRVTVTGPSSTLNVGQTTTLVAAAFDASGASFTNPGATTWSSSAATVAGVDQSGKATAAGAGSATITADIGGVKGTFMLTVRTAAVAKDTIVTIGMTAFSPTFLTVPRGATVVFALGFDGIGHDVQFAAKAGAPDYIVLSVRKNVPVTFPLAGDFSYTCPTHPQMTGVITVQ